MASFLDILGGSISGAGEVAEQQRKQKKLDEQMEIDRIRLMLQDLRETAGVYPEGSVAQEDIFRQIEELEKSYNEKLGLGGIRSDIPEAGRYQPPEESDILSVLPSEPPPVFAGKEIDSPSFPPPPSFSPPPPGRYDNPRKHYETLFLNEFETPREDDILARADVLEKWKPYIPHIYPKYLRLLREDAKTRSTEPPPTTPSDLGASSTSEIQPERRLGYTVPPPIPEVINEAKTLLRKELTDDPENQLIKLERLLDRLNKSDSPHKDGILKEGLLTRRDGILKENLLIRRAKLQNMLEKEETLGTEQKTLETEQNTRFENILTLTSQGGMNLHQVETELAEYFPDGLTPNQQARLDVAMKTGIVAGMKLGQEAEDRARRAWGIKVAMDEIEEGLRKNPDILKQLGPISGRLSAFMADVSGETNWIDIPGMVAFMTDLGVQQDTIGRLQSGAAMTVQEQEFYKNLVGDITKHPVAFIRGIRVVGQRFGKRAESIYRSGLQKQYGTLQVPDEAWTLLMPPSSLELNKRNLDGMPAGTTQFNPDTGQYEVVE